eukprot:NODE_404_length_2806_cov_4.561312_g346_i0.p1 GENE.NODE_404_length_2806_cov_4.561312_g346_i0~~NODE_404_length_2806_cov_4.561312_g346_i0.p1  ORF type:complete len:890 (-),score=245.53 NODE_404_length_2806_cov_4.561312_g346_i0:9-2678(-)
MFRFLIINYWIRLWNQKKDIDVLSIGTPRIVDIHMTDGSVQLQVTAINVEHKSTTNNFAVRNPVALPPLVKDELNHHQLHHQNAIVNNTKSESIISESMITRTHTASASLIKDTSGDEKDKPKRKRAQTISVLDPSQSTGQWEQRADGTYFKREYYKLEETPQQEAIAKLLKQLQDLSKQEKWDLHLYVTGRESEISTLSAQQWASQFLEPYSQICEHCDQNPAWTALAAAMLDTVRDVLSEKRKQVKIKMESELTHMETILDEKETEIENYRNQSTTMERKVQQLINELNEERSNKERLELQLKAARDRPTNIEQSEQNIVEISKERARSQSLKQQIIEIQTDYQQQMQSLQEKLNTAETARNELLRERRRADLLESELQQWKQKSNSSIDEAKKEFHREKTRADLLEENLQNSKSEMFQLKNIIQQLESQLKSTSQKPIEAIDILKSELLKEKSRGDLIEQQLRVYQDRPSLESLESVKTELRNEKLLVQQLEGQLQFFKNKISDQERESYSRPKSPLLDYQQEKLSQDLVKEKSRADFAEEQVKLLQERITALESTRSELQLQLARRSIKENPSSIESPKHSIQLQEVLMSQLASERAKTERLEYSSSCHWQLRQQRNIYQVRHLQTRINDDLRPSQSMDSLDHRTSVSIHSEDLGGDINRAPSPDNNNAPNNTLVEALRLELQHQLQKCALLEKKLNELPSPVNTIMDPNKEKLASEVLKLQLQMEQGNLVRERSRADYAEHRLRVVQAELDALRSMNNSRDDLPPSQTIDKNKLMLQEELIKARGFRRLSLQSSADVVEGSYGRQHSPTYITTYRHTTTDLPPKSPRLTTSGIRLDMSGGANRVSPRQGSPFRSPSYITSHKCKSPNCNLCKEIETRSHDRNVF